MTSYCMAGQKRADSGAAFLLFWKRGGELHRTASLHKVHEMCAGLLGMLS